MGEYAIREDDLTGPAITTLLRLHLNEMHQWSLPESVHAMPIERLRASDVTFYSVWDGEELAACGAIKQLGPGHGEIKSMRAHPAYRGKGAGKAVLDHLIAVARTVSPLANRSGTIAPIRSASS
jgi:putative acetyltransferase